MKKMLFALGLAVALGGTILPPVAEAQRFRPVRAPLIRPDRNQDAIEKKNQWVRTILSSAWTGVFGGALLFGVVTTGLVCYRWATRVNRVKEPWELEPPKKDVETREAERW